VAKGEEELYWQQEYETMPREKLAALQLERLQRTVQRAYDNVPHYRKKLSQAGATPGVKLDLRKLRTIMR